MDNVACFYINLAERKDRDSHIRRELAIFSDVTRVEAVKHSNGAYGLALSSLHLLDLAERQDKDVICVFEDDFQWEISDYKKKMEEILQQDFELVLLSYQLPAVRLTALLPPLARIENGFTTCGYIFKKSMISPLREVFTKSRDGLLTGRPSEFAIDVTWMTLQSLPNTYAAIPRLGKQLAGFSDIEKREVMYGGGCIVLVEEHKPSQREKYKDCPFPYHHYEPGKIDEALSWVKEHYPHLDYIVTTNDSVDFDFMILHASVCSMIRWRIDCGGKDGTCFFSRKVLALYSRTNTA
jgi:hypothetical protein